MTVALLLMALGMGFFGSPHCLGMCGGIVTAFGLSMQSLSASQKSLLIMTYHFGRLLSYALLGVIAGLIGTTVLQPILVGNSLPRLLIGGVLILVGLSILGLPLLTQLEKAGAKIWQSMSPIRQKIFPLNTVPKALIAGLLWGFLPCGLVYGALLMAVVGRDTLTGAMLMFAFGLGTLPMLLATQGTVVALQARIKLFRLRQANGIIMALSGLAVIFLPMAMHHGSHSHHHEMPNAHSTQELTHEHSRMHDLNHHSMPMPIESNEPSHEHSHGSANHNH